MLGRGNAHQNPTRAHFRVLAEMPFNVYNEENYIQSLSKNHTPG